jgi:hypothetical protein
MDGRVRIIDESPAGTVLAELELILAQPRLTVRDLIALRVRARCAVDASASADIDSDAEVAKAHTAFERRSFLVLVADRQLDSLDDTVDTNDTDAVTFIRLLPLAGG